MLTILHPQGQRHLREGQCLHALHPFSVIPENLCSPAKPIDVHGSRASKSQRAPDPSETLVGGAYPDYLVSMVTGPEVLHFQQASKECYLSGDFSCKVSIEVSTLAYNDLRASVCPPPPPHPLQRQQFSWSEGVAPAEQLQSCSGERVRLWRDKTSAGFRGHPLTLYSLFPAAWASVADLPGSMPLKEASLPAKLQAWKRLPPPPVSLK